MNAGSVCKRGVAVTLTDDLERIANELINIAGSIRNERRMERAVRQ